MIISSIYPSSGILKDNKESKRKRYRELVSSLRCVNRKPISKCKLFVEVTKKGTVTGKTYNKDYLTYEQLKEFYSKLFKTFYLKNADIQGWEFIEKGSARISEINIKVQELL